MSISPSICTACESAESRGKREGTEMNGNRRSISWPVRLALGLAAGMIGFTVRASVFQGEISDSQCATNVHAVNRSHKEMLKMQNMGGTSAECSRFCVKDMGGVYVLLVKNQVYHLDNQELAERNAGRKVKVSGTLDAKTKMIHVTFIPPIS